MPVNRRAFVHTAGMAAAGVMAPKFYPAYFSGRSSHIEAQARKFRLNYAPHFGMFRQHAGEDLVAQLEFMAAEGFTALEDNGMRGRPVEQQELIGKTLARLNMKMGVFVAHTIDWNAPSLTFSSDSIKRDAFLKEISESVEIAKRVNATWMTVVPGHVDRRPHMDYQTVT